MPFPVSVQMWSNVWLPYKPSLTKAHAEAHSLKEKAEESAALLRKEQEISQAAQSKVVVVEEDLSKRITKCDALKATKEANASKISHLGRDL